MEKTTKENPIVQLPYKEIVQLRNVISNKEIDSSFINKTSKIDEKPATGFSTVVDDGVTPANPTGLTATAGIQFIFLQWTYNTETDMSHYEIWRNTTNNNVTATKIAQTKANVFADESVMAGTAYFYWIKAVDHLGNVSGFNATAGSSAIPRNVGETDVTDNAITAPKINVINLAAINADLGTVIAGTVRGLLIETNSGATTGIKIDNTSLRGYGGAGVKTFELIRATGALTLKGTIESGSTIIGSTITGGLLRTSASGGRVEISETNRNVAFYGGDGVLDGSFISITGALAIGAERNGGRLEFGARPAAGGIPRTIMDIRESPSVGIRMNRRLRITSGSLFVDNGSLNVNNGGLNVSGVTTLGGQLSWDGHAFPTTHNLWSLGKIHNKIRNFYRTNEFSCALPTSNCALDVIKKIKKPRIRKGDFGKRHYFEVKQFPKEMKANIAEKGKPEELDIEMTRTLGVAIQAIRELMMRVEKIENNIKIKI